MNVKSLFKKHLPRSLYLQLRKLYCQRKRSVSQLGQDFWVFGEVFNEMKNGFFLDVGAADGVAHSNTFLLEKRYHWSGICIEPNPVFFEDLRRVRNVNCLNLCVDAGETDVDFVQKDLFGGIVGVDTDNRMPVVETGHFPLLRLRTRTLSSVLKANNAPRIIDYLSIDVEGAEDRILCDFPFDEFLFRSMTIERPKTPLREVLAQNGYILVREIPNHDVFYVHKSFYAEYQENVFSFWKKYSRKNIGRSCL